jgi:hypothetical protein
VAQLHLDQFNGLFNATAYAPGPLTRTRT